LRWEVKRWGGLEEWGEQEEVKSGFREESVFDDWFISGWVEYWLRSAAKFVKMGVVDEIGARHDEKCWRDCCSNDFDGMHRFVS
jgi:hypothetical protein